MYPYTDHCNDDIAVMMVTSGWWWWCQWKYLRRWQCHSAGQQWWWQWQWRCWQWRCESNDADKGRLRLIPSLPWLSLSHTITSHQAPLYTCKCKHFPFFLHFTNITSHQSVIHLPLYQHHQIIHFLLLTFHKHHLTPPYNALTFFYLHYTNNTTHPCII